jgi:hypothetical protein
MDVSRVFDILNGVAGPNADDGKIHDGGRLLAQHHRDHLETVRRARLWR